MWIAGLYTSHILKFLRKLCTVFHSGCTILPSHPNYKRVPFSPHPHQQFLSLIFLIMVLITGMRWYFMAVLICAFLIISDVEHFFTYPCPFVCPLQFGLVRYGLYYVKVYSFYTFICKSIFFFNLGNVLTQSNAFPAFIEIIMRFLTFILLMWYLTLMHLWMLNHPAFQE